MPAATDPMPGTTPRPGTRDPLVDGLRTVALGRVVLWHAFAAPWLSWIFPAMPVMFFLAGSVLAGSALSGSALSGSALSGSALSGPGGNGSGPIAYARRLARRLGRLLIPFWVYSLGLLATMLVAGGTLDTLDGDAESTGQRPWQLALSLLVPLHQTTGTDRDWLTGHLWYLTDYLLLVLLLPVAMVLARRIVPVTAVALAGLVALEVGPVLGLPALTGSARVAAGDLLCYGLFALLGIAWATRRPGRVTAGGVAVRAMTGGLLIAATLAAALVVPLPRGSLNESYLLLAVAALGWLLLIGAAEQPLRRWAGGPRVAAIGRGVSARALTVYLWHPAAILLALSLAPDGLLHVPGVLAWTVLFTAAAVLAFGWVEDVAARRPPRWWPGRRPRPARRGPTPIPLRLGLVAACASLLAVAAVGVSGVFVDRAGTAVAAIPRPSDRTALADTAFVGIKDQAAASTESPAELPVDELQDGLDAWILAQPDVDDAVVSVASGTQIWSGSGTRPEEALVAGRAADAAVGMASLTKTFTAALAVQFAADGVLDLDAAVPELPGVAPLPDGVTVTARQLLQHSTGLVQYNDAVGYDPAHVYTAAELVSLSTRTPLLHVPGAAVSYSNSNYLWLGLLLESLTAQDYGSLLSDRITAPLGLATVGVIDDERAGWVGSSSGGITAAPADVARFFDALLNRGEVLSREALARMTELNELNTGLGLWPLCPCGEVPEGGKWATGLGHYIGDGAAFAFPDDALAVYIRVSGPAITAERMTQLRDDLLVTMRDTATRSGVEH